MAPMSPLDTPSFCVFISIVYDSLFSSCFFTVRYQLLQEILDNSLGAWYEAKDYLVDDLLRVCEISKDAFLTRTRRGLRSKIDVCDQIIDRDVRTRLIFVTGEYF